MKSRNGAVEHSWVARPWLARLLRIIARIVPIGLALALAFGLTAWLPSTASTGGALARWVGIAAASTLVLVAIERLTRRLLPLSTLYSLTLAFPDRVPSRFRIAIRIGTAAQLRRRLAEVRRGEVGDTPGEVAERMLELVGLLSKHDRMTRGHSERVRAYTHVVGKEMGLSGTELDRLRWSALLHDIGKLTVSAGILNKAGRLTDEEFDEIKTHPMAGRELVEPLAAWLGDSVRAVWEHHERFDGGGYPQGLAGEDISLAARIVCVTDAFDVMTSTRSYKAPMPAADARRELARCAGTQFDPAVVRAFLSASLGRLETRTGPVAWLTQLATFPRAFASQLAGTVAAGTVVGVGAVGGLAGVAAAGAASLGPDLDLAALTVADEGPSTDDAPSAPGGGGDATARDGEGDGGDEPGATGPVPSGAVAVVGPGFGEGTADPAGSISEPDGPAVPVASVPVVELPGGTTPTLPPVAVPTTIPGATLPPASPGVAVPTTIPGVTLPPASPGVAVPTTIPGVTLPTTIPGVTVPTVIPGVTLPPVTVPPVTVPPVLPGVTVPPVTVPPVLPGVTVPPVTVPPVTVPVVTMPPTTLPPVTVPVVTVSPTTLPPVTVPVVTVSPTTLPPVTVPPVTVPPTTAPPTTAPPATLPPATLPPVTVPVVTVPGL